MTLDQWSNLAEIVSSLAVVATLLYLSIQIRQSNALAREQTREHMNEGGTSEVGAWISDPSLFEAFTKPEISQHEKIKLHAWLTMSLRHREYEWYAWKDGVIDSDQGQVYREIIPIVLGVERSRAWWSVNREAGFDPEFVSMVDELLQDCPLITDYWALKGW